MINCATVKGLDKAGLALCGGFLAWPFKVAGLVAARKSGEPPNLDPRLEQKLKKQCRGD